MVKDKFADSTIVKAIEANYTDFDVSATALIVLKDSGVSQTVIEAMLSAGTPKGANAAAQAARVGKQAQASSPQLGTIGSLRAAAPNAIASAEYASLLRRSRFETRHTARSASLS